MINEYIKPLFHFVKLLLEMDDILCNNGIVITVYQEVALFCYIPGQYFRDLEAYDTNS